MFSKRYTSLLEPENPAWASWPAEGSLQTIPVPPENFWTCCLYNLEIFHFCQLLIHCYSKIFRGRLAISYPSNLYCAQTAATCHSLLQNGDSSRATEADPPGRQPWHPTPSKLHPWGSPYLPGTPPNSTSCSPATFNPANANKRQTNPFSKTNGHLAACKRTFVVTPYNFCLYLYHGEGKGETTGRGTQILHALPKPRNWNNPLILHISQIFAKAEKLILYIQSQKRRNKTKAQWILVGFLKHFIVQIRHNIVFKQFENTLLLPTIK